MRAVFINPHEEPFVNIGLAYVISSAEKEHQVKLLDMAFHTRDYSAYVLENVGGFKPQVIGFSVTSFSINYALKIASLIRAAYPDIRLIYGGVHPTLLPEETLKNPLVDAVCIGEGEDAFKEYLDKLQNNREPKDVPGIWYKDKSGSIIKNPLRPFRQDLDSLPFPNWDHWDIDKYLKTNESFLGGLRFLGSRGCPYTCTFCSNPAIQRAIPGKYYRHRSPENIIQEIKFNRDKYASKGFKNVTFGDATFGMDQKTLEKFCALYKKENFDREMPWDCQTRAELVTENWAKTVARAGCCMVTLGVESGDEYVRRKIYKKDFSNAQALQAIANLKKFNIAYCMSIIVGSPDDSLKSINNTLSFLKETRPLKAHITFYQHLPYTELSRRFNRSSCDGQGQVFKSWNAPRSSTLHLGKPVLKLFMLRFLIRRVGMFFYHGFKLKGAGFLSDLFKYLFNLGHCRFVPLNNYCFLMGLEQFTLYRYALEKNRTLNQDPTP